MSKMGIVGWTASENVNICVKSRTLFRLHDEIADTDRTDNHKTDRELKRMKTSGWSAKWADSSDG